MSHADEVREYCKVHYIDPARDRGDLAVGIRAGDVHREMNYSNRLPLVCSAIGAAVFEESLHLKRVAIDGPLSGSSTLFVFILC